MVADSLRDARIILPRGTPAQQKALALKRQGILNMLAAQSQPGGGSVVTGALAKTVPGGGPAGDPNYQPGPGFGFGPFGFGGFGT